MKIEVPYTRRRIGGREGGYPEVTLRVRTRYGDYVSCRFIVDSGADFTAIPVSLAEREGIPFSRSQQGVAGGLVGEVTKYRGTFRPQLGGIEYEWPCDFLDRPAPGSPGGPMRQTDRHLPVLGRAGFLDTHEFCTDGVRLTLIRRTLLGRWFRLLMRWLERPLTRFRTGDDPL
jgi:hypothetical protein